MKTMRQEQKWTVWTNKPCVVSENSTGTKNLYFPENNEEYEQALVEIMNSSERFFKDFYPALPFDNEGGGLKTVWKIRLKVLFMQQDKVAELMGQKKYDEATKANGKVLNFLDFLNSEYFRYKEAIEWQEFVTRKQEAKKKNG